MLNPTNPSRLKSFDARLAAEAERRGGQTLTAAMEYEVAEAYRVRTRQVAAAKSANRGKMPSVVVILWLLLVRVGSTNPTIVELERQTYGSFAACTHACICTELKARQLCCCPCTALFCAAEVLLCSSFSILWRHANLSR